MSVRWHIRTQGIPLHSTPAVRPGSRCSIGQPLATMDYLPGNMRRLDIAGELGVDAPQLRECMVRANGAVVSCGDIIAVRNAFGYPIMVRTPVSGTVLQVSSSLGCAYIRELGTPLTGDVTVDLSSAPHTGSGRLGAVSKGRKVSKYCVAVGDEVAGGQPLAIVEIPDSLGALPGQKPVSSPCRGRVKLIDTANARITIEPREVTSVPSAYAGYVVGVAANTVEIAIWGERITGAYGIGNLAVGPLCCNDTPAEGSVWVIPHRAASADLKRGRDAGVAGIWASSIEHRELEEFAGREQVRSVTAAWDGPVVVISEGFGDLTMPAAARQRLLEMDGRMVTVSGRTHLRAGAIRPELLAAAEVPASEDPTSDGCWDMNIARIRTQAHGVEAQQTAWNVGTAVRGIWGHRQGWRGRLLGEPESTTLESGVRAAAVLVRWEHGLDERVPIRNIVPLAEEVDFGGRQ